MPITIRLIGQDADQELASLYTWLRNDDDIRRHAHISVVGAEPASGEMGSAFDIIQLAVDGSFQALNFALAYASWRSSRRSRPRVTIECKGNSVELHDGPETVDVIVRALE